MTGRELLIIQIWFIPLSLVAVLGFIAIGFIMVPVLWFGGLKKLST